MEITLEQALAKARPGLRYRMEKSVALIRKAERMAKLYDPENGFYLAFSGGKDSQALFHITALAGVRFKAHFSPTTIDPPQLIRFIRRQYPMVEFEKVEKNIYDLAIKKKMFPTKIFRWCCAEFKERWGVLPRVEITLQDVGETDVAERRDEISIASPGDTSDESPYP